MRTYLGTETPDGTGPVAASPANLAAPGNAPPRELPETYIAPAEHVVDTRDGSTPPPDLTPWVGSWLRAAMELTNQAGVSDLASELGKLDENRRRAGFRLAFVGEASRGKSTLINRLLGTVVIPTGPRPTTNIITYLAPGLEDRMEVPGSAGPEVRPLAASSWSGLAAETVGNEPGRVRVTLDNQWLRAGDLELVDTPGVRNPATPPVASVLGLFSECDGVVMVVSATSPFSLTEAALLDEALAHHVPKVIVVISRLDCVPKDEREQITEFISGRIGKVAAAPVALLSAGTAGPDDTADATLEQVRAHVAAVAAGGDRRMWRSRQTAGLVAACMDRLAEAGTAALDTFGLEQREREREVADARQRTRLQALDWDTVRMQVEERRLSCEHEVRERIARTRDRLAEQLGHALAQAEDPPAWAEHSFPLLLRDQSSALGQHLDEFVVTRLERDYTWLRATLRQSFDARMKRRGKPPAAPEPSDAAGMLLTPPLKDTQRMRLLSRLGIGAATIAGHLIVGPWGLAAGVAWGLVGEQLMDKQVREQRQVVGRGLERALDRFLDGYAEQVSERLRALYGQLVDATASEESAWLAARLGALEAAARGNGTVEAAAWREIVSRAVELRDEITAALQG